MPRLLRIALSSLWQSLAPGKPRFASRHRSVLLERLASMAASGAVEMLLFLLSRHRR